MPNMLDKRDHSFAPNPNGKGSQEKVEKYRWAKSSSPGEMMHLSKDELNLDDQYQRERVSEEAVVKIARNFDWALFGVLKVARRTDGTLWVFDGGHRLRACFYRSDIKTIPCIVFSMDDIWIPFVRHRPPKIRTQPRRLN